MSLPIAHQLFDGDTTKFVRTHLITLAGAESTGPFNLVQDSGGLYVPAAPVSMPLNQRAVFCQNLVYSDAGYTTLDPVEGPGLDVFFLAFQPGDSIPIAYQAVDEASGIYVRAHLFDDQGAELPGSPVNLIHYANGLYLGPSNFPMPNIPFVRVQAKCYTDSGYTQADPVHSDGLDTFPLTETRSSDLAIQRTSARILRSGNWVARHSEPSTNSRIRVRILNGNIGIRLG